ncbi:MAG: FAD-binding protein, partial [bacterium]
RDVVSRAILRRMIEMDSSCMYLDVTHIDSTTLHERFPTIIDVCEDYDIDITSDYIPVRPCAHYCMGGVHTDLSGSTSKENLYVIGETACSGVHGANRLASNSLLEGLVMGVEVVKALKSHLPELKQMRFSHEIDAPDRDLDWEDLRQSLKSLMWRQAGILREREKLEEARNKLERWLQLLSNQQAKSQDQFELKNMMLLGRAIVEAALNREESRGAHFRTDYPGTREDWRKHSLIEKKGWSIASTEVKTQSQQ